MAGGLEPTDTKEMLPPGSVDVEAGVAYDNEHEYEAVEKEVDEDEEEYFDDPFDIANTKNAPPESLRRWRVIFYLMFFRKKNVYMLPLLHVT